MMGAFHLGGPEQLESIGRSGHCWGIGTSDRDVIGRGGRESMGKMGLIQAIMKLFSLNITLHSSTMESAD